jgi:hypothetical protein
MNHDKVLDGRGRNCYAGGSFGGRRQGGEERERQVLDGLAKLGPVRSVPGINGVEGLKRRHVGVFYNPYQIQAGIRDRPSAIGKSNQGQNGSWRPDFGVICAGGFERGQGQDDVSDRTRADQQPSHFSFVTSVCTRPEHCPEAPCAPIPRPWRDRFRHREASPSARFPAPPGPWSWRHSPFLPSPFRANRDTHL